MITDTLIKIRTELNIPVAYSHFQKPVEPPYIVYIGSGQDNFKGDNTLYWRENTYQVELYFTEKNEELENSIEEIFLSDGHIFSKSEDNYIESEGLFLIYYYL